MPIKHTPNLNNSKKLRAMFYPIYADLLVREFACDERFIFEDRELLERIIFPYLLILKNPRRILDIGREAYEKFYNLFFIGRELWTIDRNPSHKNFGSKNHIIDNVVNLKKHFKNRYFDLVIMNGVFGWGLNQKKDIETAIKGIYDVLKTNGILIFGWNDALDTKPIPLEHIQALKQFKPYYFKPFKGINFKASTNSHIYNFYNK